MSRTPLHHHRLVAWQRADDLRDPKNLRSVDGAHPGARVSSSPSHLSYLSHPSYLSYCLPNRWFSSQMNSMISCSGMMRWLTRTLHGFVYTFGSVTVTSIVIRP
jgi:hypothetical protein